MADEATQWAILPNGDIVDMARGGEFIATVYDEENAPLIAAAPELLAALKTLTGIARMGGVGSRDWYKALDEAEAAISKAKDDEHGR